jgi:hypothetical protein
VASGKKIIGLEDAQTGTGGLEYDREIHIGTDGKVYFLVWDGSERSAISTNTFTDNRWHHAVGVITGDGGNMKLYVDGVLQQTTSIGTILPYTSSSYWRIGGYMGAGWTNTVNGYFTGSIDEARIYNRVLTATEVVSLYNSGSGKVAQASKTGLIGYWSLDDATSTIATDLSGNGKNGTLTNMDSTTDWIAGKRSKALDFDGSNDHVDLGSNVYSQSQLGAAGTISAWFKLNALPASSGTMSIMDMEGIFGDQIINSGGNTRVQVRVYDGGVKTAIGTTNLTTGRWYHYIETWDSTTARVYLNGVEENSVAAGAMNNFDSLSRDYSIGKNCNDCGSGTRFNGAIDDVRVYSRALSPSEAAGLYGSGAQVINTSQNRTGSTLDSGLVGMWSFNGQDISGTTAYDRSGNGNNGALTNGPTKTIGKVGQALSFDGVDDAVTTGFTQQLTDFTACAWFKSGASPVGSARILEKSYTGGFWVGRGGGANSWGGGVLESSHPYGIFVTLPDQQWNHICSIRSSTTHTIIGNGGQVSNSNTVSGSALDTTALAIGYITSAAYIGLIDEVRIYNRALSASEVKQLYNLGK